MYDVAIIGAGVVGAMMAQTLSKYNLKICIVDKENDVAMGATISLLVCKLNNIIKIVELD